MDVQSVAHYDAIAEDYDDLYGFWYDPLVELTVPLLDLNSDICMADIGGGTGAVAESIHRSLGNLKNPICVVDPSHGLIMKAMKRSNIIPIVATADEFLNSCESITYNRILFSQSVHHLPHHKATFETMYDIMPTGSVCVIIGGSRVTRLPLWKSARENFGSYMTNEVHGLRNCGFDVRTFDTNLILHLSKKEWYDKIRSRIFSFLSLLSDEEIESKIKEIDRTLLFNCKNDKQIEMNHNMRCIVATKS